LNGVYNSGRRTIELSHWQEKKKKQKEKNQKKKKKKKEKRKKTPKKTHTPKQTILEQLCIKTNFPVGEG